ncbi:hypothetical protein BGX26_011143 [Mortierella sp. AD094]|nr:hypothetical protein BGX26_011143 [Mortierella sp. AD094]
MAIGTAIEVLFVPVFIYGMLMPESLTAAKLAKTREIQSQATVVSVEDNREPDSKKLEQRSLKERIASFFNGFMPKKLPNRLAGKYSILLLMLTVTLAVASIIAGTSVVSTYLLYRFRWSNAKLSSLASLTGISRLITLTLLLPFLKKLAPHNVLTDPAASISYDLKLVVIGLIVESATLFLYGVTPIGEGFYVGAVLGSFGTMYSPASRGILSQSVSPGQIGETLGTLVTLELLTVMAIPLGVEWLYSITLETWPSAVFEISGLACLASSALAISVYLTHNKAMRH